MEQQEKRAYPDYLVNESAEIHVCNHGNDKEPSCRPESAEIFPVSAPPGDWEPPALQDISLRLLLSGFAGRWRGKQGSFPSNYGPVMLRFANMTEVVRTTLIIQRRKGLIALSAELMGVVCRELNYQVPDTRPVPMLRDRELTCMAQILFYKNLNDFENGPLFSDGIATILADYLWKNYSEGRPPSTKPSGGLAPAVLRKSIAFIQAHLGCDIRLVDLAREAGLSRSHYIRSFRQSMGITPHQYVLSQRIERARSLLSKGSSPLADVALRCGFADQHHLARTFRRFTGMTPRDFRKIAQQ